MVDLNNNLSPGDPLPTSVKVWNPILEAARKATQGDAGAPSPTGGVEFEVEVRIKNTESTTCPRLAPIGIADDAVIISPSANAWAETPVLKGTFPKHNGNIAIALEPILQEKIGRAKLRGLISVVIDVQSEAHRFAEPKEGEFKFISVANGRFPIVWKESGTGEKKGHVQIGSDPDTSIRQTAVVNESYDDAIAGSPVALMVNHEGYDNARDIPTPSGLPVADCLNLDLNSGQFADHAWAIEQGTVAFHVQNKTSSGNGKPLKTVQGGFFEAIIYQLDNQHHYAILDGPKSSLAADQTKHCLISSPSGPYRILGKKILAGQPTTYPHYVRALVADQTSNFDTLITSASGSMSALVAPDIISIGYSTQAFSETNSGRDPFGFPSGFDKPGAPKPLVGVAISVSGHLVRGNTGRTTLELAPSDHVHPNHVAPLTAPLSHQASESQPTTLYFYPAKSIRVVKYGLTVSASPTWQQISERFMQLPSGMGWGTVSTPPLVVQHFAFSDFGLIEENFSRLRWEIQQLQGYVTSAQLNGCVVIHRYGDRGMPVGSAPRRWGLGITPLNPVGDPEPP